MDDAWEGVGLVFVVVAVVVVRYCLEGWFFFEGVVRELSCSFGKFFWM